MSSYVYILSTHSSSKLFLCVTIILLSFFICHIRIFIICPILNFEFNLVILLFFVVIVSVVCIYGQNARIRFCILTCIPASTILYIVALYISPIFICDIWVTESSWIKFLVVDATTSDSTK